MRSFFTCMSLFGALFLSLSSCEKEIDFKYYAIEPLTVIEAELTDEGAKVGITLTTPMGEPMDITRLLDAEVSILDVSEGSEYVLKTDDDGYFRDSTPGIVGHNYRLTVKREGKTYYAETPMYPPVKIKDIQFNWISMPYDKVAVFQAQFIDKDAPTGQCYWIKLYRNGKIYLWQEMNNYGAKEDVCYFMTMTTRQDTDEEDESEVLYDGDVMTVSISAVSKAMHDYLEALQNDSNGPAMFQGDNCLGYFIATTPVSDSIIFHPASIPVYQ